VPVIYADLITWQYLVNPHYEALSSPYPPLEAQRS